MTSLIMSNAAFLSKISQRSMKELKLKPLSTSLLTPRDNLSTYLTWLITYHHLRFTFSVLKSFIRVVEERALFLGIELRFTSPIGTRSTFPSMFLSVMFQLFEIQCPLKLRRKSMVFSGWKGQFCWTMSFY